MKASNYSEFFAICQAFNALIRKNNTLSSSFNQLKPRKVSKKHI